MARGASVKVRINPEAELKVREAILASVTELFELEIKPEAQRNSPTRTGTNRRSIDVEVTQTPEGPRAILFTQSGYGGYLEVGTRYMVARPYIFPAAYKFVKQLAGIVGNKIKIISSVQR